MLRLSIQDEKKKEPRLKGPTNRGLSLQVAKQSAADNRKIQSDPFEILLRHYFPQISLIMMLDRTPARPNRRPAQDYDEEPHLECRESRTKQSDEVPVPMDRHQTQKHEVRRCLSLANIHLSHSEQLNDTKTTTVSDRRFDAVPSPDKERLLRRCKKDFVTRQSLLQQPYPFNTTASTSSQGAESSHILKDASHLLGLNSPESQYKVVKVKSKSALADAESSFRSPIRRSPTSRRGQPRRALSCPKISLEEYLKEQNKANPIVKESASTAPKKRGMGKKSRSCPRNLGEQLPLLPTIGEGEVLNHNSDDVSCGSSADMRGGSIHSRSSTGSPGSRKCFRRGKRAILSRPTRSASCRDFGSGSKLLSPKEAGPRSPSMRKLTSQMNASMDCNFDRFQSYEQPPPSASLYTGADSGPMQRSFSRKCSMEPPKAPTRILSPPANSNRKTTRKVVNSS